jgi:leucyl/phenylalanyl-tRNA---protein transferase
LHGTPLTPQLLLGAYAQGLFPMAERRDSPELYWVSPEKRGVIPLETFHVPQRLARTVRAGRFTVTADRAFAEVMHSCAGRDETWINDEIIRLYTALFASGHARTARW